MAKFIHVTQSSGRNTERAINVEAIAFYQPYAERTTIHLSGVTTTITVVESFDQVTELIRKAG